MSTENSNDFVASGQSNIYDSPEYRQKVAEIRAQVWARYQEELTEASVGKKVILRWRIWREIRRACAELAPPHALYLRS